MVIFDDKHRALINSIIGNITRRDRSSHNSSLTVGIRIIHSQGMPLNLLN